MNQVTDRIPFFLFFGILFFITACGGVKEKEKTSVIRSESELLRILESQRFPYTWMTGQLKGRWSDQYSSQRFSVEIRMRKDSVIWASATKFGFEVGRLLVRKDSAFFINRLNNEYFAEPVSYLAELGYPVSLREVQHLLMGRPLEPARNYIVTERDTNYYFIESPPAHTGLKESYILKGAQPRIHQMHWSANSSPSVKSELTDYQNITDNKYFSYVRVFNILGLEDDEPTLSLEFKEVTFDEPAALPFRIPPSYSNME